ncbi:MAG: response regulator [Xanthomonadaceae bacterium]|nr:response regulator [Xanthomonadaceae bacterium]
MSAIRVVLVENPSLERGTLAALLEREPGLEVVAHVTDGRAALAALVAHAPDVLLTDAELPNMTGFELAAVVQLNHPDIKVVMLKDTLVADLADAIRTIAR